MTLSTEMKSWLISKIAAGEPLPENVAFNEIRIPISEGVLTIEFLLDGDSVSTYAFERIVLGDTINMRGFTGSLPISVESTP